jgi:hypothetical protein
MKLEGVIGQKAYGALTSGCGLSGTISRFQHSSTGNKQA